MTPKQPATAAAKDADHKHANIVGKDRCKCGAKWHQGFGGGWKGYSFHLEDVLTRIAIEAEATAPDVDVLARAIERTPGFGRDRDYAERLAAEYVRLMRERQPAPSAPTGEERLADFGLLVRRMVWDGHPNDKRWFDRVSEAMHEVNDLLDARLAAQEDERP